MVSLVGNSAEKRGGGLLLNRSLLIISDNNTTILFENNTVTSVGGKGGAVYVKDTRICNKKYYKQCFLQGNSSSNSRALVFVANSADNGLVLYAGGHWMSAFQKRNTASSLASTFSSRFHTMSQVLMK